MFIKIIDKKLNNTVDNYINIEIKRLTSIIVNQSIRELSLKKDSNFIVFKDDGSENVNNISYNTDILNFYSNELTRSVQNKLLNLEDGDIADFLISNKFKKGSFLKVKNGLLVELSMASINKSTLFSNIGPTIPIKFVFVGDVIVNMDVDVKEYGINNVIVQLNANVIVNEIATMPITSKPTTIEVKEPVSIDIIRGNIPKYYSYLMK